MAYYTIGQFSTEISGGVTVSYSIPSSLTVPENGSTVPAWILGNSQDSAMVLTVSDGSVTNDLYIWYAAGASGVNHIFYSLTSTGGATEIDTDLPADHGVVNVELILVGGGILVGTIETLADL